MKPSSAVLAWFILISDIFASASGWKEKARIKINLQPSDLFVRCGNAEYTSVELDNAANEACYLKLTQRKRLGFRFKSQPKSYEGDKLTVFNDNYASPNHYSQQSYDHNTHVLNFEANPPLMWPLKNKFKGSNAKCYAIIEWTPARVKCKAMAVIIKEKGKEEIKCHQVSFQNPTSKYAGSPLYRAGGLSPQQAGGLSPPRAESPIRSGDTTSSPGRGASRVPTLSTIQE